MSDPSKADPSMGLRLESIVREGATYVLHVACPHCRGLSYHRFVYEPPRGYDPVMPKAWREPVRELVEAYEREQIALRG